MTAAESAEFDAYLDRWEAKLRRSWDRMDAKRYRRRKDEIRAAMTLDDPRAGLTTVKPSLNDYDGHIETHGQDT